MNKQNKINKIIYDKLLESEQQLKQYLLTIRHKQQIPTIKLQNCLSTHSGPLVPMRHKVRIRRENNEVSVYIDQYLRLVREVMSIDNYIGKKIIKKIFKLLQEFPSMGYLMETIYAFGQQKKKLCLVEETICQNAQDQMIPLFQKIIQKIQNYKKQVQSKKLMELGHRIEHLHLLIDITKDKVKQDHQNIKILRNIQSDRIQKYLTMEENISKVEKQFGNFSTNLLKNKEIFTNINKVCLQIKNSKN